MCHCTFFLCLNKQRRRREGACAYGRARLEARRREAPPPAAVYPRRCPRDIHCLRHPLPQLRRPPPLRAMGAKRLAQSDEDEQKLRGYNPVVCGSVAFERLPVLLKYVPFVLANISTPRPPYASEVHAEPYSMLFTIESSCAWNPIPSSIRCWCGAAQILRSRCGDGRRFPPRAHHTQNTLARASAR